MLWGLSLLIPSLALLVVAFQSHSLPLLLIGSVLGGGAAALGYRGSLQIVNQIAPDSRRAEVVSSYLMFCYAGVSLPVIGIGVLSAIGHRASQRASSPQSSPQLRYLRSPSTSAEPAGSGRVSLVWRVP